MKILKSILAGIIIFSAAGQMQAQEQVPGQAQGQAAVQEKKPLDHSVYDKWETLGGYAITDNGEWISYYSNKEENDGKVVVMNLKSGKTIEVPRGSKTKFSPSGTHITFTIRPTFAQQKEAKIKKLKGDKAPKDTLGIMELATGNIAKFPAVKGLETPREGGNFIAFKVEHKEEVLPDSTKSDAKPAKKAAKPKTEVITLIYDLAKSRENTNQRLITFYEKMYDDLTKEKEEKRNQKIRQVQEIWLSYLREVSSTIPFEDDIIETKNYVQSQISLLVTDIMDDKI